MTIFIDVTQEKIDRGTRMTCCSCPIAKSVNREATGAAPRITSASIAMRDGHCTVETSGATGTMRMIHKFALPDGAIDFVAKWDARKEVRPIAFELQLVGHKPATSLGCTL